MSTAHNGNIILIDPNDVNINPSITNSIPQYQDMFIFAELKATRKGRTVLETASELGNGGNILKTGLEKDVAEINFIGVDQNINSPNYLKFTTNYYDGSNGNEGFGMSSIKVIINSSFVPQVSIQFIDVRGLAFFNRENSPYRILFDFPPPIFILTIKGYYGKSIQYKLHLVKYTSEFKAENGNFVIDAQFVAVTFAPLSDVLFRYIVNFPLIQQTNTSISLTPQPNVPPKNTYELILKLKNLYDKISKELKTLPETQKYDTTLNQLAKNASTLSILADYKQKLNDSGTAYLITVDTSALNPQSPSSTLPSFPYVINNNNQPTVIDEKNIISTTSFSDYDNIIKSFSTYAVPANNTKKLYIVFVSGKVDTVPYTGVKSKATKLSLAMDDYKNQLINSYQDVGLANTSITIPSVYFSNSYDITALKNNVPSTIYTGIDITDFYMKLYKERTSLISSKGVLTTTINGIINNIIMKNLGMMPSIYNIFEILLNDVDTFFQTLRDVSNKAEVHHNNPDYNKIILNTKPKQYVDIKSQAATTQIYSFPLVIDQQNITGGQREVRVAPIKLSQLLPEPFPELTLVENFIETFNKQRKFTELMNAKNELNADGTYKWIPISPLDSKIGSSDTSSAYTGPYFGIDTIDGGGSTTMPINLTTDTRLSQVLKIVLDRFYILSQSSYPASIYGKDKQISRAYIDFFAKSEAANLANSMTETKYASNIKDNANKFVSNLNDFYTYLNTSEMINHYIFTPADKSSFPLAGDQAGNNEVYVDKENGGYRGSIVTDQKINLQNFTNDTTKPVDKFQNDVLRGLFGNILKGREHESFYNFTDENLLYVQDKFVKDGVVDESEVVTDKNGVNIKTRYLDSTAFGNNANATTILGIPVSYKSIVIPELLASGNTYFRQIGGFPRSDAASLKNFDNIINPWIFQLSNFDTQIYNTIINNNSSSYNQKLSALMFLSNYGYSLSPFNQYPNRLNPLLFTIAGVLETPSYIPAYLGALITATDGSDPKFTIQTIKNFFLSGSGKNLTSSGYFIFADLHDVSNYLSTADKAVYKARFDTFLSNIYPSILTGVQGLYTDVNNATSKLTGLAQITKKEKLYTFYLNPKSTENGSGYRYYEILSPLITRTNIVNYSEITFSTGTTKIGYTSLQTLNTNTKTKAINDSFFKTFFGELLANINTKQADLKKEETANEKLKGDEDVITQTYYSFKNINDKWLTAPNIVNQKGYPSNESNRRLIDYFAFVDRAMNPIGDTIINVEILSQIFEDPNVTVFSALSQLLSLNGFEFFPLQNFMSYTQKSWEDSFIITPDISIAQSAAFVCMYIGGTSSYPTGVANGFVDDGITDLSTSATVDFKTKPPLDPTTKQLNPNINSNSEDGKQITKNVGFPWGQVRAFRVRFGEQNQSMFTDIKIDSKEYPETNESLQILARLAGDNKIQAPVPKGQNLYNLYENRAYKATIIGLGNAMIQPTQYFQLENVPLFSGAYIILTVEHNIEPNKMTTSFAGTKILRYPVLRVLNPAAIMGFDGGDSDQTNPYTQGAGVATQQVGAITMSDQRLAQLNSVYGVDVSAFQPNFNWSKAANSTNPDYPSIKFAIIKVSQGKTRIEPLAKTQSIGAKGVGLKIGYYHYAQQFNGNSQDAVIDAKAQAAYFVSTVKSMPNKSDFPLMLDVEDNETNNNLWTRDKTVVNLWINTFIGALKNSGYTTMLYSGKPWLDTHTTGNFNNIPLWHSQYPQKPEQTDPSIAEAWKKPNKKDGWTVWQFSSSGRPNGYNNNVDINAMKKNFFDSPTTA